MKIDNKLLWLNVACGGIEYQVPLLEELMIKFPNEKLIYLEVGSAFGGGVEFFSKLLGKRGLVYGYDTFEGHPKDLSYSSTSNEALAMDAWYKLADFKPEHLTIEYQQKVLKEEGIDNAILVKGRINEHSFDDIEKAHMIMLDMDLVAPMKVAYESLKDKVVKGGYLLVHDALPEEHMPRLYEYYRDVIKKDSRWLIKSEVGWLVVLERI